MLLVPATWALQACVPHLADLLQQPKGVSGNEFCEESGVPHTLLQGRQAQCCPRHGRDADDSFQPCLGLH